MTSGDLQSARMRCSHPLSEGQQPPRRREDFERDSQDLRVGGHERRGRWERRERPAQGLSHDYFPGPVQLVREVADFFTASTLETLSESRVLSLLRKLVELDLEPCSTV